MTTSPASAARPRTGPSSAATTPRSPSAKLDWLITQDHLATLRATYTNSKQENGTFDVDSWGRSANAIENDDSRAVSGTLISTFSNTLLNEFRFQFAKENRPRPYNGPDITGQTRPLPDTAFDFGRSYRFGEPFFIPVDYYDTRVQFNENLTIIKGAHEIKLGFEYNHVTRRRSSAGSRTVATSSARPTGS